MTCKSASLISAFAILFGNASASGQAPEPVPGITVEAQRNSEQLRHAVDSFLSMAIDRPHSTYNESLERWTYVKVCPHVAGLNKTQGEFFVSRLSQIARAAGVPLAGEKCIPNFIVLMTEEPESLLKKLTVAHGVFDDQRGLALDQFIVTPRPIRVWRNVGLTSIDGANHFKGHGEKYYDDEAPSNTMPSQYGSRLNVSNVTRDILSAIVVVDAGKVHDLNFGQLTDYIALVGFVQIDMDHDLTDAPTILNLFKVPAAVRPQEMTSWDKAMLRALYSTPQRNLMQLSEMETVMVKEISGQPTH
jgi:hypothetical protein